MSLLFFIGFFFFLWFIYIRLIIFCTALTHPEIKKKEKKKYIYIEREREREGGHMVQN